VTRKSSRREANHPAFDQNLLALFAPRSVAVVGASRDPSKLGFLVLRNVRTSGFPGPIYPVNPIARRIQGLRAYPSVASIPGPVDLAIVVVPQPAVLPVIRECAAKRVRAAIIITSGFRETGPAGARAEEEIVAIARSAGMRILGPNCLGVIDTVTPLNASFAARMPISNGIAFMSQSGALGAAILDWAAARDLGFSKFVSLGNEADVTESDLLQVWEYDESVRVVSAYLEGISDGSRFRRVATRVTRQRPVIVLKAGRTAAGSRAVVSHTGALAGSDNAYSAAFRQAGIIRAKSLEELFDASLAFSSQPLPGGRDVTIITNAGGPSIVATDAAEMQGLKLTRLAPRTTEELRRQLPPAASVTNPIDVLGDAGPDLYRAAIDTVVADPRGDALLVILTPQLKTDVEGTARVLVEAHRQASRPIIACFMGSLGVRSAIATLSAGGIPNYPFPERAVSSLAAMADYAELRKRPIGRPRHFVVDRERVLDIVAKARAAHRPNLDSFEAAQVLTAYGIAIPRAILAHDLDEAIRAAEDIGFPVVLKVASPDIVHKSEAGGVRVGLRSADEVRLAYAEICRTVAARAPTARIDGIGVWSMAPPGVETIVGLSVDPTFGHLLLFGLGGIFVEVIKDVSFRVVPITPADATSMIHEIRAFPILQGARGRPPSDLNAIGDVLERVSQLAEDFPEIRELDINPLIVYPPPHGVLAVDARLSLSL
jgi:acetyl coenzyme A synthetase (ADP forming)-like protein